MVATMAKPVRKPKPKPKPKPGPRYARDAAIAVEIERLRASGYGADIGGWVTRHNGRKLSIEEAAALNVDRAPEFAANVRAVCEARRFPATHGNEVMTRGAGTLADQYRLNKRKLKQIAAAAKRKGYSPSDSDFYMEPFEALFGRGDPRCFVKQQDGRHYVRDVLKANGLGCEGIAGDFDCAPVDPEKVAPQRGLHPAIVERYVQEEIKKDPELPRKKSRREVVEQVIEERAYDASEV